MQTARVFDWNDLKHFLAVARTGSTTAAARSLGVDQTTTARRISALEQALGLTLFERRADGYRMTEAARSVLEQAERVEAGAEGFADRVNAHRRQAVGTVRITTNEIMAGDLVAPAIPRIRTAFPGVKVELVVDDRRYDLSRGEADIALRAGSTPEGPGLMRRRMPDCAWSVYCSAEFRDRYGSPADPSQIARFPVIGGEGSIARLGTIRWIERKAEGGEIALRCNTLQNLIAATRSGLGLGCMPCMTGDKVPGLVRCFPPPPELDSEVWLIWRESVSAVPHIRACIDVVAEHILSHRKQMGGAL